MKQNRFSKIILWLIGACFFLLLLALMGRTVIKAPLLFSFYENRNLNPKPLLTKEGVLNGEYFSGAEEYLRDRAAGRETLLKANTYLDLRLLERPVVNDVLVDGEKVLAFHNYEAIDEALNAQKAKEMADEIQSVAKAVEKVGGKYYYMAAPSQSVVYAESYPDYLNSSYETDLAQVAALTKELQARKISYIDLGKEDWKAEYMSVVDHHYILPGILHTYETLIGRINLDTDLDLKVLKEGEDYTVKTLPNPHIGSRSRKLMGLFQTEEKISYAEPIGALPFERYDYGGKVEYINNLPQTDWQQVLYGMYMGGDIGFTRIETHREELPSILIYGDSFTNGLESVVWQNFDAMYTYDRRLYSEMTIEECVEKYQPDIVVYMRNYSGILEPGC